MSIPRPLLFFTVAAACFVGVPSARSAEPELLPNPGFESALNDWTASPEDADQGMSKVTPDAARTGKGGLHVVATGTVKTGSSLTSEFVPAQPGDAFQVDFWVKCEEASGVGVFLQFSDDRKHLINPPDGKPFFVAIPSMTKDWTEFHVKGTAPEGAAFAAVWVHSWSNAACDADFDDFSLKKTVPDKTAAPKVSAAKPAKPGPPPRIPREQATPRVSAEQVQTVAAMLDATPRGVGRPITDRAAWEQLATAPGLRAAAIANAERLLPEPETVITEDQYMEFFRSGRAAAYQAGVDRRRYRLVLLVQAECFENRGRFLPAIEKEIETICSEYTWVAPPHDFKGANIKGTAIDVDLISAMTVWNLATADWLLGDHLQPATRQLIRDEAERRVFEPFLAEARGQAPQEWWSTNAFNWNAVVHSGIVGAATALIDEPARRAEIIAYAVQNVKTYLSGFMADGYTGEGLGYWDYGFGHYTLLAETLLAATHGRVNLYADDRARLVAQMPKKLEILPNVYPAFSDCLITDRPALWALDILDHRYGFGWQMPPEDRAINPAYGASLYAVALNEFFDPHAPVVYPGKGDAKPGYHERDALPDAQIYIARPAAPTPGNLGLAFKGGVNNAPHGHLDLGSYVVALGRDSLILDPGAPVYTRDTFGPHGGDDPLRNSHDHDVPLVAGQRQRPGADHRATVLSTNFTDALDSVTLDLTRAYDVPALKQLTRRFDYGRAAPGVVTVTDAATFHSPETLGTALVTLGQFRQVQPGLFLVYQHHTTLQVAIDTGGAPFTTKDEPIAGEMKSGHGKPRRLGIDLTNPALAGQITLRITPAAPVNPDPSLVPAASLARLKPDYARALTVKAGDFIRQDGGTVVPATGIGTTSGAVRAWQGAGHALTWKFHVPAAGTYGLQVRHCGDQDDDTGCTMQADGAVAASGDPTFFLPPTGGWSNEGDDWETAWIARDGKPALLKLAPGDHEITLTNRGGQASLNWVRLVPFDAAAAG